MKTILVLASVMTFVGAVSAAVPQTLTYQGRMVDTAAAPLPDGLYLIQFRIYDAPSGGTTLWDSDFRQIMVVDGLFSYNLGDTIPLPHDLFTDTARWLGTKVGSNPEMSPRIKLASFAYAYHALRADTAEYARALAGDPYVNETGDTMTGDLVFNTQQGERVGRIAVNDLSRSGTIDLWDQDADEVNPLVRIFGDLYAEIQLRDGAGTLTTNLNAGAGSGGQLWLFSPDGPLTFALHGGITGDGAALIPEGAVSAIEMFNEPGLASSFKFDGSGQLSLIGQTFDTLVISAPSPGYVKVLVTGFFDISHTQGSTDEVCRAWVDNSTGLSVENLTLANVKSAQPTGQYWVPCSISYVEAVAAGTTTLYLTGDGSGSGSKYLRRTHFTAEFFPTAYGTIDVTKSAGSAAAVRPDGSDLPAPETYDASEAIRAAQEAERERQRREIEEQQTEAERLRSDQ